MDGDTIHMANKCIICKCELDKEIYIVCEECYEKYFAKLVLDTFCSKSCNAYATD
ncbi:MAG: hypothetical protein HPY60_09915 [Candidatus Methanofastidiosum sp.]|nr:hypothetical protein [Methanofastidiosum sp.]